MQLPDDDVRTYVHCNKRNAKRKGPYQSLPNNTITVIVTILTVMVNSNGNNHNNRNINSNDNAGESLLLSPLGFYIL